MNIRSTFHKVIGKIISLALGPVTLTPVATPKNPGVFEEGIPRNLFRKRGHYSGGCPKLTGKRLERTLSNCHQLESDGPVMLWIRYRNLV